MAIILLASIKCRCSPLSGKRGRGKNRYAFYAGDLEDVIQPESQTDVAEAAVMDQKLADQNLTGYVLDILSRSHSMEKSINQLLEIVGRQVDVSRVYIFEDDEDGKHLIQHL